MVKSSLQVVPQIACKNILGSIEKFSSNVNPLVPACWSYLQVNLPRTLKGHHTVVYHDKMLVIGGYSEENDSYSDIIYEVQLQFPFTTKILAQLPFPKPTGGCGVVLVNDKILIFGGERDFFSASANVRMYDLTKNEFKELEALPYGMYNMATVRYRENVIVAGNTDIFASRRDKNAVISYNIRTQNSTELPPMNNARSECCAVVDGNSLVVMGGEGEQGYYDRGCIQSAEAFDFKSSKGDFFLR